MLVEPVGELKKISQKCNEMCKPLRNYAASHFLYHVPHSHTENYFQSQKISNTYFLKSA